MQLLLDGLLLLWLAGPNAPGRLLGYRSLLFLGQGGTNVERAQKEGNFCYLAALTFAYHFEWNAMKCGLSGLKLGFLQCMITTEQLEQVRQVISQR